MVDQTDTEIDPKALIAGVRRDLDVLGRYYYEKGEQDLVTSIIHLSALALALHVCIGRIEPTR
jgi:hypothetical protein